MSSKPHFVLHLVTPTRGANGCEVKVAYWSVNGESTPLRDLRAHFGAASCGVIPLSEGETKVFLSSHGLTGGRVWLVGRCTLSSAVPTDGASVNVWLSSDGATFSVACDASTQPPSFVVEPGLTKPTELVIPHTNKDPLVRARASSKSTQDGKPLDYGDGEPVVVLIVGDVRKAEPIIQQAREYQLAVWGTGKDRAPVLIRAAAAGTNESIRCAVANHNPHIIHYVGDAGPSLRVGRSDGTLPEEVLTPESLVALLLGLKPSEDVSGGSAVASRTRLAIFNCVDAERVGRAAFACNLLDGVVASSLAMTRPAPGMASDDVTYNVDKRVSAFTSCFYRCISDAYTLRAAYNSASLAAFASPSDLYMLLDHSSTPGYPLAVERPPALAQPIYTPPRVVTAPATPHEGHAGPWTTLPPVDMSVFPEAGDGGEGPAPSEGEDGDLSHGRARSSAPAAPAAGSTPSTDLPTAGTGYGLIAIVTANASGGSGTPTPKPLRAVGKLPARTIPGIDDGGLGASSPTVFTPTGEEESTREPPRVLISVEELMGRCQGLYPRWVDAAKAGVSANVLDTFFWKEIRPLHDFVDAIRSADAGWALVAALGQIADHVREAKAPEAQPIAVLEEALAVTCALRVHTEQDARVVERLSTYEGELTEEQRQADRDKREQDSLAIRDLRTRIDSGQVVLLSRLGRICTEMSPLLHGRRAYEEGYRRGACYYAAARALATPHTHGPVASKLEESVQHSATLETGDAMPEFVRTFIDPAAVLAFCSHLTDVPKASAVAVVTSTADEVEALGKWLYACGHYSESQRVFDMALPLLARCERRMKARRASFVKLSERAASAAAGGAKEAVPGDDWCGVEAIRHALVLIRYIVCNLFRLGLGEQNVADQRSPTEEIVPPSFVAAVVSVLRKYSLVKPEYADEEDPPSPPSPAVPSAGIPAPVAHALAGAGTATPPGSPRGGGTPRATRPAVPARPKSLAVPSVGSPRGSLDASAGRARDDGAIPTASGAVSGDRPPRRGSVSVGENGSGLSLEELYEDVFYNEVVHATVAQGGALLLSAVYGDLVATLFDHIVRRVQGLLGRAPCEFAFVSCGVAGEMCTYSALDAILLVKTLGKTEEVYFERLARMVELQMIALGETPFCCSLRRPDSSIVTAGLFLGRNGLSPCRVIITPEELADHQFARIDAVCNTILGDRKRSTGETSAPTSPSASHVLQLGLDDAAFVPLLRTVSLLAGSSRVVQSYTDNLDQQLSQERRCTHMRPQPRGTQRGGRGAAVAVVVDDGAATEEERVCPKCSPRGRLYGLHLMHKAVCDEADQRGRPTEARGVGRLVARAVDALAVFYRVMDSSTTARIRTMCESFILHSAMGAALQELVQRVQHLRFRLQFEHRTHTEPGTRQLSEELLACAAGPFWMALTAFYAQMSMGFAEKGDINPLMSYEYVANARWNYCLNTFSVELSPSRPISPTEREGEGASVYIDPEEFLSMPRPNQMVTLRGYPKVRQLTPKAIEALFENGVLRERMDVQKYGRRTVIKAGDVFLKHLPEVPGYALAVTALHSLIFGGAGMPQVDVACIVHGNREWCFLLTEEVQGENLKDVLVRPKGWEDVTLDPTAFSEQVVMSILTNPEDGKPDNFILVRNPALRGLGAWSAGSETIDFAGDLRRVLTAPDGQRSTAARVVPVDSDHAFVAPFDGKKVAARVKSIVLLMDAMNAPLSATIKDALLAMSPGDVLGEWIDRVQRYHDVLDKLFTQEQKRKVSGSDLSLQFRRGFMYLLYDKLCSIQVRLLEKERPSCTNMELMEAVEPRLADVYSRHLLVPANPLVRFETAFSKQYKDGLTTITTGGEITREQQRSRSTHVSDGSGGAAGPGSDMVQPSELRAELDELLGAQPAEAMRLLIQKDSGPFRALKTITQKQEALQTLNEMLDRGELNAEEQRQVLNAIEGTLFRKLVLNCDVMTDDILAKLIKPCIDLEYLSLPGASQLVSLPSLSVTCPYLGYLNVVDSRLTEKITDYIIDKCLHLRRFRVKHPAQFFHPPRGWLSASPRTRGLLRRHLLRDPLAVVEARAFRLNNTEATAFSHAMRVPQPIVRADFSWNEFSDEGAEALVGAWMHSSYMRTLDLRGNKLSPACAARIRTAVRAARRDTPDRRVLFDDHLVRIPYTQQDLVGAVVTSPQAVVAVVQLHDGRVALGLRDGKILITILSGDGTNVDREDCTLRGQGPLTALAVLPDDRLVSASSDGTIRVLDVTGRRAPDEKRPRDVVMATEGKEPVRAISVMQNGRLVSGGDGDVIVLWDVDTKAQLATRPAKQVLAVETLPNGMVASGGYEKVVQIWDWNPNELTPIYELPGSNTPIVCIRVLVDGRLGVGSLNGLMRVWDFYEAKHLVTVQSRHTKRAGAIVTLPTGQAAVGYATGVLEVIEPDTGTCVASRVCRAGVAALCLLDNGRLLVGECDL